jgi:hypothetical protein
MKWPWWHRQKPIAQMFAVNPGRLELETAKLILGGIKVKAPNQHSENDMGYMG